MNWLRTPLSYKLGFWMIQRRLKTRVREVNALNFKEVQRITLIADLSTQSGRELLNKQLAHLKKSGKKNIDVIAYRKSWKEEDKASNKNLVKLSPEDFNWLYHPKQTLKNLILTKNDLLIFLGVQPNKFLLNYLALSKAKFKVGLETNTYQKYLDLTIKVGENQNDKFLKSLNHYLNLINKPSYAA